MVIQNDVCQLFIPCDETKWRVQPNYQGSFVTLFGNGMNAATGYEPNIAVMIYPRTELSMRQIYMNTVYQLRQMLMDFTVQLVFLDEDSCEFEYSGNVQNMRICFVQRIFRSEIICSVTGGCCSELSEQLIPELRNIAKETNILRGR